MQQFIQDLVAKNHYQATRLLDILRAIQSRHRYIPTEAIELLAGLLAIPRTRIISVIEFYSFFSDSPRGQYELLISDSITDHMLGKTELIDYLAAKLNVAIGGVRDDGLVSLDNTSCTGMCDQGPAGLVNGLALTRLDKSRIDAIADLINRQIPLAEWPAEFFQVDDNIHKPGLLLNHTIAHGDALRAAFYTGA